MKPKFDTYTIYARIYPGILCALPLVVIWFFLMQVPNWKELLNYLSSLKFYGTITLSGVFLFFYSQFIRMTSKYFERKYFINARGFPTTYLMLYSDNTLSSDYKNKFRERVKKVLKLDALNESDETAQPQEAQKRLNEIFNHIRLKVGNGKLVLKHNIWYGFSRNLIGGTIYSSIFCLANILLGWLVFKNTPMVIASCTLLAVYFAIFLFRKAILFQNAEAYARQLISEFMTTTKAASRD